MKQIYAFLLILVASSFSYGQMLLNDGLNYTDDSLLTDSGWTVHSGGTTEAITVGASNGLTYTGYTGATGITGLDAGNAAKLDNTGQDVNKTFTSTTSGTIYYSFLVKVGSTTPEGYFINIGTSTNQFAARVFVKPSANLGKINFGLSNSGTASYATTPTDFDFNTTYLIIVKYDVSSTGAASIWVKTTGVPATEAAAGTPEHTTTGAGQQTISGIYLRQYNLSQNITVDGIFVATTWMGTTPCAFSLGTGTTVCNAITTAIDNYTITIPFTGGTTGTYNLTATAGTIGGDNPNTVATGNITITNITEGTNVTLNITGTCTIDRVITAPECKPVNTLPYVDHFNYTVGNTLGNEQTWSVANSGPTILVTSGNLNYTGVASSGNSASLSGFGSEAHTTITPTTSGIIYASFIMKITDNTAVTEGNEAYFAAFTDGDPFNIHSRIFTKKTGATYQLGLGSNATASSYSPTFFNLNDVVYVVIAYDFENDLSKVWINPTIATFTESTTPDLTQPITFSTFAGFMFRQDDNTKTPSITVDELRIANTVAQLGVAENNISGLSIYPNPANDFLHITTTANSVKTIAIYDVVGKQVLSTTTSNEVINVSSLNAGIYMVKITEEGKIATRKLVVK